MDCEDINRVYIEERLEEQRSKLVHIKSTFNQITQNVKTIQNTCYLQKSAPPIHYSEPVFKEFDNHIDGVYIALESLKLKLWNINSDRNYEDFMRQHIERVKDINDLIVKVSYFQRLLDQRAYGLHIFKILEYHPALLSEYGLVGKVYNAVDALSYELMGNLYGREIVEEIQYVPLSLFGDRYLMLPIERARLGSFLIMIPYYDCFRSRFWPALAHETAHIIVYSAQILKSKSKLYKLMRKNQQRTPLTPKLDRNGDELIHPQMGEIVCDIISTYVCGPASFFSGSALLSFTPEKRDNSLINIIENKDHPPIGIRVAAMRRTLEKLRIFSKASDLEKMINSIQEVLESDTKLKEVDKNYPQIAYSRDYLFISQYKDAIKPLTDSIFSFLKNKTHIKPFTDETWENVTGAIDDGSIADLTPIELMNVAWSIRLKKGIADHNLSPILYIDKRMNEAKLFETLVNYGRESAIGCYLYILFIYATWGVAKWAKGVQSLDS